MGLMVNLHHRPLLIVQESLQGLFTLSDLQIRKRRLRDCYDAVAKAVMESPDSKGCAFK